MQAASSSIGCSATLLYSGVASMVEAIARRRQTREEVSFTGAFLISVPISNPLLAWADFSTGDA